MHMIFDMKQQYLQNKARIVVGGHVMDSTKHTIYSSTTEYMSVRLLLSIALKNGLRHICGAVVVLKQKLFGLKTESNSFKKYLKTF